MQVYTLHVCTLQRLSELWQVWQVQLRSIHSAVSLGVPWALCPTLAWIQVFSFSVFEFCLRNYSGIFPQTFRNICGETEKQKNWKTEFSREIQEEILHMDSVFQFFSFSVFQFFCFSVFQFCLRNYSEYFRRHFGIFAEKLKNWKTEFSREIQEEILHMDSVFQFFCFSVFLFFSLLTELYIPEYFRRHFGIFAKKLKNRKTEKLNFPERSRKRFSIWIQFFSFSVLWQNRAGVTG